MILQNPQHSCIILMLTFEFIWQFWHRQKRQTSKTAPARYTMQPTWRKNLGVAILKKKSIIVLPSPDYLGIFSSGSTAHLSVKTHRPGAATCNCTELKNNIDEVARSSLREPSELKFRLFGFRVITLASEWYSSQLLKLSRKSKAILFLQCVVVFIARKLKRRPMQMGTSLFTSE